MTPEQLTQLIEEFLAESPRAVVVEEGQVLFDLCDSHYSVNADHGRCVLHLWSEQGNAVRRVVKAERKDGALRLSALRFGKARPHRLELVADRDRRTPTARKLARTEYQRLLQRLLLRQVPGWTVESISTAMDLERSFSPVYTRALLRKGQSLLAVLGANSNETQSAIDGALTFGLLWLDHCRTHHSRGRAVEGLTLVLPRRSSAVVRARMAWLDRGRANFQVLELDEKEESFQAFDPADSGNIVTRLVRCPEEELARDRFAVAIADMRREAPECETVVLSASELSFRLHGLEFARARLRPASGGFARETEIVFGAWPQQSALLPETEGAFRALLARLMEQRRPRGDKRRPLWRMHPERWMESLVKCAVASLDEHLDGAQVYSQVPAFAASDRAMIDVLTATRAGRLAVIELKADEDIHLPVQGLDYWARVWWHHQRGEFPRFGYFAGRDLKKEPPLLYLVAPALRVHPATDTLLGYFSPQVQWTLLGVDERWREGVRVVFRKSRA